MRDFQELLKVKDKHEHESASGMWFQTIERLPAGDFSLSIQASATHYCQPRKVCDLDLYYEWELAIFDSDDDWVNPHTHPLFRDATWLEKYEEGVNPVGGYLTTEEIQSIYEACCGAKEPIDLDDSAADDMAAHEEHDDGRDRNI